MANTHEQIGALPGRGTKLVRSYEVSAANTELTVTTPTTRGRALRLLYITVSYSGSVTKNATVTLNSGAGADMDNLLTTIAISAANDGKYLPDGEIIIEEGDSIDVVAEAGGAGVTCGVAIVCEEF